MLVIDNKFNIKDIVYCKIDVKQLPRFVDSIVVTDSAVLYSTSTSEGFTVTYADYEISKEKTLII